METEAKPISASQKPPATPLRQVAGEIRLAWVLSRSAEELAEGLAARGIGLAAVSRDEAEASYRAAAFAKTAGDLAVVLKEGEIVAVDGRRGDVFRFNERITGDEKGEIEKRLAGINRAGLRDVAATKDLMREAWAAEKAAERARARINAPVSGVVAEIRTAWILSQNDDQWHDALAARGMTIAGVTSTEAYSSERVAAFAAEIGKRATALKENEVVVVSGAGYVYRLDERTTGQTPPRSERNLRGSTAPNCSTSPTPRRRCAKPRTQRGFTSGKASGSGTAGQTGSRSASRNVLTACGMISILAVRL